MALTSGDFRSYDDDRMVVRFTMMNADAEVPCAVSTDAMDRIEGKSRSGPAAREEQFLRLRTRIEEGSRLQGNERSRRVAPDLPKEQRNKA